MSGKLPVSFTKRVTVAATGYGLVQFKDAAGNPAYARCVNMRCVEDTGGFGATSKIHFKMYNSPETITSNPDANSYFLIPNDTHRDPREEDGLIYQMKFYNTDAAVDVIIQFESYSDHDISGTTTTP